MKLFDISRVKTFPLMERINNISIEEVIINPDSQPPQSKNLKKIEKIADRILYSKEKGSSIMLAFGAHLIRNGCGLILREMIEKGLVTHLATNGAGSIHDWEFAYQGKSCEDVKKYVSEGQFGLWEETGKFINLSLLEGAKEGLGYGESVGKMIHLDKIGNEEVSHLSKKYSVQESAFVHKFPFTIHPSLGQDITHIHSQSDWVAIAKTSYVDYLRYTESVSNLKGGVYLSIGSAVMSPQVFEKSLAIARNVAHQDNKRIDDFIIGINDIQDSGNWQQGKKEPSTDSPEYYKRLCKSFSRMGAKDMHYIQEDNKIFLHNLYHCLKNKA